MTTQTTAPSKTGEAIARLDAAVTAVTTSIGFTDYLRMKGRFHSYSFGNVMLICTARPDATRVAGFNAWKAMGRMVKKGERGIPILVPHRAKHEDEATGETRSYVRGFGVGYVFDIAQTEGDDLPEPPAAIHAEGDEERAATIAARVIAHLPTIGIGFTETRRTDSANGAWMPGARTIMLRDDLNPTMRAKTLCHELAHCLCDHGLDDDRTRAETVAEAAAFVALAAVGVDTAAYSVPYLAGWGEDVATFRAALKEIEAVSAAILKVIHDPA